VASLAADRSGLGLASADGGRMLGAGCRPGRRGAAPFLQRRDVPLVADHTAGVGRAAAVWPGIPAAVTTSITPAPSRCRTATSWPAWPGGTEYRFPCQDTSACADTVRVSSITAG
jgi:hypothetical protein